MYKPINGYTKTSILEALVKGNNNKRSLSESGNRCLYRGAGNNKCAVGCFIPDELYHEDMEGNGIRPLLESWPSLSQALPLEPTALFQLQKTHDEAEDGSVHDALVYWVCANVEA